MSDVALRVMDAAVGVVLMGCAVVTWLRQRRVGAIMGAAGVAWFVGNVVSAFVLLHRGPMVHLHISYPTGRLRRPLAVLTVTVAYIAAFFETIARNPWLTGGLAVLVAAAAVDVFSRTSGPARKAGVPALAAAFAFAGVLALSSANILLDLGADRVVLVVYDAVVSLVAIWLTLDLRYGGWTEATVTDLVTQLGSRVDMSGLQGELRRWLADPSLVLGFRVGNASTYVDESGSSVQTSTGGRVTTPIIESGEPVAVLVHDPAVLQDPTLLAGATAALRLAVVNARMRAEVHARAAKVAASSRRIVEAADAQRGAMEQDLASGAERHLSEVARILGGINVGRDPAMTRQLLTTLTEVERGQAELRQFAHGIRPPVLRTGGLGAALPSLAVHSAHRTDVSVTVGRLPPAVEAALYFVCAEALANVAKHADASEVTVSVSADGESVVTRVTDNGRGGVDPAGSGLRGLADRVEALGGSLKVGDRPGGGTIVEARIHGGEGGTP
jgi:signal transduction histidine kinase